MTALVYPYRNEPAKDSKWCWRLHKMPKTYAFDAVMGKTTTLRERIQALPSGKETTLALDFFLGLKYQPHKPCCHTR